MSGAFWSMQVGPYSEACPTDGATVMADSSYRVGASRRGVLVCHSAGQRHHQQANPEWWPVPRALAESGRFVCLACDLGDPSVDAGPTSAAQSWGNDHALARLSDAYRFLIGPGLGASGDKVVLAGTSMGGLLALEWARRHRNLVHALVLGCPVLDLVVLYGSSAFSQAISAAYGAAGQAALPVLGAHSPARHPEEFAGLPIRIYASSDDPVASSTEACRAFARSVGGDDIRVVDLGPAGHWPVATPVDDVRAFLEASAALDDEHSSTTP